MAADDRVLETETWNGLVWEQNGAGLATSFGTGLDQPSDLDLARDGAVYVSDTANNRVVAEFTIDLAARELRREDGDALPFEIDDYTRWRLLEGLDDIGLTERHLEDVEAFEARRPAWLPRTQPA